MPRLIDRSGPREDPWQAHPERRIGLADWDRLAPPLLAAGIAPALVLEPADDPALAATRLADVALVAVRFPVFTDGRGYSTARLLRTRYGWRGELRAIGDIRRDQLFYLARCGFDTFELLDGEPVDAALAAFGAFSEVYQAGADRGPLFARRSR